MMGIRVYRLEFKTDNKIPQISRQCELLCDWPLCAVLRNEIYKILKFTCCKGQYFRCNLSTSNIMDIVKLLNKFYDKKYYDSKLERCPEVLETQISALFNLLDELGKENYIERIEFYDNCEM